VVTLQKKSSETCHASVTGKKKICRQKNQFGNLPGDSNERQKKPKKIGRQKKIGMETCLATSMVFLNGAGGQSCSACVGKKGR